MEILISNLVQSLWIPDIKQGVICKFVHFDQTDWLQVTNKIVAWSILAHKNIKNPLRKSKYISKNIYIQISL